MSRFEGPRPVFRLPEPVREHPAWVLLSILVHLVVVPLVMLTVGTSVEVALVGGAGQVRPHVVSPVFLAGAGGESAREGEGGGLAHQPADTAAPGEPGEAIALAVEPSEGVGGEVGGDTTSGEVVIGTGRIIGPAYGDGRLWVSVRDAELGVVGPSESVEMHVARVDSAIRERLRAFMDTMPRDSFALPPSLDWTFEGPGGKWGVDPQWIYLGDLKVPTALLALLPLPQGNYDQAQRAAELQRMRMDILQAARRAETAEQFRKYVEEIRKRKDAEREAGRGARPARRDTIIP